jgi:hypothetical protein
VLTAIAAKGGTGKTRFCADLLRRVHYQLAWPDGQPMSAGVDTLALWVVSDNHHDEMVTLAQAFGIKDSIRINAFKDDPYGGVTLESEDDLRELEARIEVVKPALVIVDTVGNATEKNLSKQEEAKAFYWPLQVLARKYRCSVLCLTHLNMAGQFLGRRVMEKVRVAVRMEQPEEGNDKRRLEVVKSNSKRPQPLGVTMGDNGNEYDHDPPAAASAAAGPQPGQALTGRLKECSEWLCRRLAACAQRVSFIRTQAEVDGYSSKTLYAAKQATRSFLGREAVIEEYRDEQNKLWWRLTSPPGTP